MDVAVLISNVMKKKKNYVLNICIHYVLVNLKNINMQEKSEVFWFTQKMGLGICLLTYV